MRLVKGVVVEVVDGHGEVVGWVEEGGVGVFALAEAAGRDCSPLDSSISFNNIGIL